MPGSHRSSTRGSRLRMTSPSASRSSTSAEVRTVARTESSSRAFRCRAVGSPSGSPASRSCRGRRREPSRSSIPAASRPAAVSSRASSRAAGAPGGARPSPSIVTTVPGPRRRSSRNAAASGRPWACASTTTATGRPENRWDAPALRTAVSHGPRAVTGARSCAISGPAARTSRTTRARPTATRMNTPESHHSPRRRPSGAAGRTRGGAGGSEVSDRATTQATALALRQPAPDAEPLVVGQRVLEALRLDLAAGADLLGLAGRAALLGEERLGVGLGAQRLLLPGLGVTLGADAQQAGDALRAETAGAHAGGRPLAETLVRGQPEPVGGPVATADVIAQPRNLGHDVASPLALAPVRGTQDVPGPLCTR